ncbi:MAG: LemA family protein [Candidatus Competibacteraceae bacterium]|nr:LemA family protein [Candidatus Competibacteraceae bacterium]
MNRKIFGVLLVALPLFMSSCGYNSLVHKDEACVAQWAQVENVYQRRSDLIPNIVATVKGEANFEQETLTKVIEARASATQVKIDPSNMTEADLKRFDEAQNTLGGTLSRLLMVTENYPTLQANQAFRDLRVELEGSENRISVERKKFIESVQDYNTFRRKFPYNITAGIFGFDKRPTFEAREGSDQVPVVDFESDK